MKKLLTAALAPFTLMACSGDGKVMVKAESTFDLGAVKSVIETNNKALAATYLTGDSAKLVSMYHSQAAIYAPNEPTMTPMTMGSMARQMPGWGVKGFTLTTSEVIGDAEGVVEHGSWEMRGDSSKLIDKGKYMAIWKMEGGTWKLFRDIWNSETPIMHPATENK